MSQNTSTKKFFCENSAIGNEAKKNKKEKRRQRTANASKSRWKKPEENEEDKEAEIFTEDEQFVGETSGDENLGVQPEIYDACHDVAGPSNDLRGSMLDLSNMKHDELLEVAETLLEENIQLNSEDVIKCKNFLQNFIVVFAFLAKFSIFQKSCFFCLFYFSDVVTTKHYNTSKCSITSFYSTNKWSTFFNDESLQQQDFDFSNESGKYKVYLVRDGEKRFNLKYIGITTQIKIRMINHRCTKTFIELKNPEYAILLENLSEKTASFLEGLLILSSQLGYNLLNKTYEFTNITKGLSDKEIAELSKEDLKNIVIEYHKKAVNILKKRWSIVEWIKF
ncbi:unnamed protein product [Meloidogyne enterolobii]|uniref:Uncharacterized protein n=1 Tax=Meloidogyne enterolobii TaxID=390850 RepID=A0ACB0XZK7_MELEN